MKNSLKTLIKWVWIRLVRFFTSFSFLMDFWLISLQVYYSVRFIQSTIFAFVKISVLILFYRIFITRSFRLAACIVGIVIFLWWIEVFFVQTVRCTFVQKNWNSTVQDHCGSEKIFEIFISVSWIVTDFAVFILPLSMIYNLHMPLNQKIVLKGFFVLDDL